VVILFWPSITTGLDAAASSEPAVLDFNNLVSAISVTANATLTFEGLALQNLASHHAADSPDYTFNRVRELQIWPSISLESGSEVCLSGTHFHRSTGLLSTLGQMVQYCLFVV
jgi:hypothetical protein